MQLKTGYKEQSLGIGLLCQDLGSSVKPIEGAMNIQPTHRGGGLTLISLGQGSGNMLSIQGQK